MYVDSYTSECWVGIALYYAILCKVLGHLQTWVSVGDPGTNLMNKEGWLDYYKNSFNSVSLVVVSVVLIHLL